MRLLVVCGSWPQSSPITWLFATYTAPQPPGPGLGSAAPSVNTPSTGPALYLASTSATLRFSSRAPAEERGPRVRPAGAFLAEGCGPCFLHDRHSLGCQPGYLAKVASGTANSLAQL